jgi:regulator of nonsense transcripts 2
MVSIQASRQLNYFQCNPPERVVREIIELPPMHSFIQHLLHDVLMKRTLDKVLKLIRKLHWDDLEVTFAFGLPFHQPDEQIYRFILNSFTEIWEIKYGNIPFVAALVYDLQRYHPYFSVAIVDQVIEDIRIGMEVRMISHSTRIS